MTLILLFPITVSSGQKAELSGTLWALVGMKRLNNH